MIDIKLIRQSPQYIENVIKSRSPEFNINEILDLDKKILTLQKDVEEKRARINKISDEIAKIISKNQKYEGLVHEAEKIKKTLKENETELKKLKTLLHEKMLLIPNIPDDTVPYGNSPQDNKVVRMEGFKKIFNFTPLDHHTLGEIYNLIDFKLAGKLSGNRFAVLKNKCALLERALINFMLDTHIQENNYEEIFVPYFVKPQIMEGTGQLPKYEVELYKSEPDNLYLIPTAEVPITNLFRDEIIPEDELPKKYVCYSACFRRESGSYGKDVRGLIRNHQFNKVELVIFSLPQDSDKMLEVLVSDAEKILKKLNLHYRVVELCRGDLGFASAKTYDIEVWMPGENRWLEISSCSNCRDFQARRMNTKIKTKEGKKEFVHTLNGSGLAIGRTMAAILENYQNSEGYIEIPDVLRGYMKIDRIEKGKEL